MNETLSVLAFRIAEQDYALPIADVVEVAAMVAMTRVQGYRPEVLGIVSRQGVPLVLLDLRQVFGEAALSVPDASTMPDASTLFIVARHDTHSGVLVGLVVDEIQQVEYVQAHAVHMQSLGAAKYIRGVISQGERVRQILALDTLLTAYLPSEV